MQNKTVLVTGGKGFLGSHIVEELKPFNLDVKVVEHNDCDLTILADTVEAFFDYSPNYVIHCAGFNGGIEFNRQFASQIFYKNTAMGLNVHQASYLLGVEKLISIMTSCAYPDKGWEVLSEDKFWEGEPNESIRSHGIAKRTLQTAAYSYNKEYGLDAICACVTNLYGPRDTFNLLRTKVVGALVRKFVEARDQKLPEVECWGSGKPLREFMYVKDAAIRIIQALYSYHDHSTPLNIGVDIETSIKELADIIQQIVGYEGKIKWLTEKGDGQMRKKLDISKMKGLDKFQHLATTSLRSGLTETIEWYIKNKDFADSRS